MKSYVNFLFASICILLLCTPFCFGANIQTMLTQGVTDLALPLLVWAIGWVISTVDDKVRGWLTRREYNKALTIYDLIAKAVDEVYKGDSAVASVRSQKAAGTFTDEAKDAAMKEALGIVRTSAQKENVPLPEEGELKLLVEQVISDRKRGILSPFLKKLGLGS